jgi:hypothetical protein
VSIDYSALFVPVTKDEVAQFKRESRLSAAPWAHSSPFSVGVKVAFGVFVAFFLFVFLSLAMPFMSGLFSGGPANAMLAALWLVAIVAVIGLTVYRYLVASSGRWEKLLRKARFAAHNSLTYLPGQKGINYPGIIFGRGSDRRSTDNYLSTGDQRFDIGNYQYTTGSDKNKTTHTWGYLAFQLERRLPHMVLDARKNNQLLASNLPASFRRDQRLSLEGDFDRHFTLYCPRAYERDALYVFTPDLMALLIDESSSFDVEIVDDWMFVYSSEPFRLDDAATVSRLFRIINTVGAKARRQTDRYADERIGDPTIDLVAPQGTRLKSASTLAGIGVIVVVVWVLSSFVRAWF